MSEAESKEFLLTRNQIRAGRTLANLGIRELAREAGLSPTAISHIETGRTEQAHESTLRALRVALERQGVEFAVDGWVRLIDDTRATASHPRRTLSRLLGQNCKRGRQMLGMTCDEVAALIGEDVEVYWRIEQGAALPSLPTLLLIADVLETSLDHLAGAVALTDEPARLPPTTPEAQVLDRLLHGARPSTRRLVIQVLKELQLADPDAEPPRAPEPRRAASGAL